MCRSGCSLLFLSVLCAAGTGCGGDDDDGSGAVDGGSPDSGGASADGAPVSPDAAAADASTVDCLLAGGCPDWIEDYEREVISALSGETPIARGVTLSQRSTAQEREATRTYLAGQLARHGLEPQIHEYGSGANVFAELPATGEGGSLVVLGAHFDGVPGAPAAADDGTGVALVLSAARYLSGLERRDLTVVFVLFDEEELGLLGSQAFAEKLLLDAVPLEGMHNFDMISWDEDDDRGVELWAPSPELEELYSGAAADLGIPVSVFPNFYSSDHAAFIGNGFAATGMGEEYHAGDTTPNYHQPSDTYGNVDFSYLASSTELAFLAIERQLGAGL